MTRLLGFILLVSIGTVAQAQLTGDIMLSYTVGNNMNLGLSSKSVYPFVAGINGSLQLSKKKYAPFRVNLYGGVRYSRSGYRVEGYVDTRPEYYKENNISTWSDDTKSKLVQSYMNVPVGIEIWFNSNPVIFKKINTVSLTLLLNNAFLLSSQLDESIYSYTIEDNIVRQSVDTKPFLESYYPGFIADLRICTYLNLGVSWHRMDFSEAEAELDFGDKAPSPFYTMFTEEGTFRDVSFYVGINIPLKPKKSTRKNAE